jgi:hypothetical protein
MLRAVEQIRRMRGGAQSHLMRCSDGNYYVVKFQNNPQHRRILVNELLGTRLASRIGLPTTPVGVVEVSQELIRLTPELCVETPRTRIPCLPGLQFASRYPGEVKSLAYTVERIRHKLKSSEFTAVTDVHLLAENERHKFVQETLRDAGVNAVPMEGFAVWTAKLRPLMQ